VKHALELWYFTETNHADDPVTVRSESELERVLDEVLAYKQPHPTPVCVQDRPTFGPLNLPDHQLKFDVDVDVDVDAGVGAIHAFGSPDFHGEDISKSGEADFYSRVSRRIQADDASPATLYIDFDTRTRFPPDAAIPLSLLRQALREFMETGRRPTCVEWQESDVLV
jgi:Immunity protein Imm1